MFFLDKIKKIVDFEKVLEENVANYKKAVALIEKAILLMDGKIPD